MNQEMDVGADLVPALTVSHMRKIYILLYTLFIVLPLHATIHQVPFDYFLIQSALDACDWGDTVLVSPGTYHELLRIPPTELTLASNYILSQDSTDINETILDGEYQGTIMDVIATGNERVFTLNGFTVKRGMGWWEDLYGRYGGGAVQAFNCSNVLLENCVFTENDAPRKGSVLSMGIDGNDGNLTLRNLKVFNNGPFDSTGSSNPIFASVHQNLVLERIHAFGVGQARHLIDAGGTDTVIVRDLVIENFSMTFGEIVKLRTQNYMQVDDIYIRHNSPFPGRLFDIRGGTGSTIRISNLWLTDNSPVAYPVYVSADSVFADSLYFLRNEGANHIICATVVPEVYGEINHIVVQDNFGGAYEYNQTTYVPMLIAARCSITDGLFNDNVIHPHYVDQNECAAGGTVLGYYPSDPPIVLENCRFIGNLHDDPDDYSDPNINPAGTQGRVLLIDPGANNLTAILRHCLFEDNRQPNIAPDSPAGFSGSHGVGSVIYVKDSPNADNNSLIMEDVIIRDNDDGAILSEYCDEITMRNVQIVNTPRRGIQIWDSENVLLENVLISGVVEQENYWSYPYDWCFHDGLCITADESAVIRNTTITACDLPYLLTTGSTSYAQPQFYNCIIAGNSYEYLLRPDPDGNNNPVYAEYSYFQEPVEGSNNIIGNDPMFHTELGAPYLDPASPCVDAGNPDPAYNDPEDPDAPGWPLWPSQGTLRNDIGFTGGPYAMVQYFESVSQLPEPEPGSTPDRIELRQNYPNPFNPATTIEFTLPYPQNVQLTVYNILGQQVVTLADGPHAAGIHTVQFNATRLASGVYIYRLVAGDRAVARKMVLVR